MSKAKGGRRERQARDILQDLGFIVEKSKNSRFENNDYFNLFDLMASRGDCFKFIQVKSNSTDGALKEIREAVDSFPYTEDCFDLEVWVCYDREGWRVQRLTEDGWEIVADERPESGKMGEFLKQSLV